MGSAAGTAHAATTLGPTAGAASGAASAARSPADGDADAGCASPPPPPLGYSQPAAVQSPWSGSAWVGGPQGPTPGTYYAPAYLGPRRNGLAVAAMVNGIVGLTGFFCVITVVCAILGIIFGFVARSQIRGSQQTQTGDGMALAGIICGMLGVAVFALWVAALSLDGSSSGF